MPSQFFISKSFLMTLIKIAAVNKEKTLESEYVSLWNWNYNRGNEVRYSVARTTIFTKPFAVTAISRPMAVPQMTTLNNSITIFFAASIKFLQWKSRWAKLSYFQLIVIYRHIEAKTDPNTYSKASFNHLSVGTSNF